MKVMVVVIGAFVVASCAEAPPMASPAKEVNGSALLINLTPTNRLSVIGALDFDLLDSGVGKACADRGSNKQYWIGMSEIAKLTNDELTRQAIAAAALDAVSRLEETDTILLTRVVTESKGPDRICASVVGRGVRLSKAPPQLVSAPQPVSPPHP